jgi:DNA-binding XRE family transcriptional regulator/quercetin dioxygenase-like cupin family protein
MGERLRKSRQARGLTLRELATRLGVSPSMISQIETGRASPSVSTLYAIATELDVSLDELLFNDRRVAAERAADSAPTTDSSAGGAGSTGGAQLLQPRGTRKKIRLASGVTWERLTKLSDPETEFLYVTYEVGGASSSEDDFQRHAGHEWGYVLEGSLDIKIGFDDYTLGPGDSISFESSIPHRLANAGNTVVHAIWFVLGRGSMGDSDGHEDLHSSSPKKGQTRRT